MPKHVSSQRENHQRPDKTVLTPPGGHDIPAAINSPGCRQGHDLCAGLKARARRVLTCRRPPGTESAVWRTRQLLLGETFAGLAAGFGIGTATAWRYVTETVALLAARSPKLRRELADPR
jgi:hypothetical protein